MNPFSPLCFIRENKTKCILLMFMMFLGYTAYFGGLYISNPLDNWKIHFKYQDKYICLYPANNDPDFSQYAAFRNEIQKNKSVKTIELGTYNGIVFKTVMGFTSGGHSYTFRSVDDFKTFCQYLDIQCDFEHLKKDSVIMSRFMADNHGFKKSDIISKTDYSDIGHDFSLDAITDEDGYTQYYITDETDINPLMIIISNGADMDEMLDYVHTLSKKYPIEIEENIQLQINEQFEIFNTIYMIILIFLSIILAITINSAFVGMYQRREYEFAVYRAIGISKMRMAGKIAGEILCMDLISLVTGGILFFTGLYLFNHLILYPSGLYLNYLEPIAVLGLAICNIITAVPLFITRSMALLKADICEY